MVYIDWQLSLVANFFVLFSILQMHRYFLKSFNIGHLISDIAISLVFGYIGLFIDDIFIILFIGFILIWNWLFNHRHLDMQNSISLIMAANVESVLFSLGTYTARIIFFITNDEWKLQILEKFQQDFIAVSLVINALYIIIFLLVIDHFRDKTVKLWIQIEQYHLGRRVFSMSFSVFLAFMVILIISDLQSVTATLQAIILVVFTIVLIVTYRQLIFFVQTIAIQRQAQAKVIYNKQLSDYLTSVRQQYTDLRKFKHDFQNIMLSMKSFVDNSDSDELKHYYQDIVQEQAELVKVDSGNIAQIQAVDSDAIRGLIIQKFFFAKSKQIHFQIELTQEHYHFSTNILIIVRILGILLDNAFEYVQTIDDKVVTCAITQTNDTIEITVDNPIEGDLNFKDIFKTGYTTKNDHTGFGLANARRLIAETDNLYLETKILHGHLLMTLIIVGGDWVFPVYLLEDNAIQREKYAEFIRNGILINDANLQLKSVTSTVEDFYTNYIPQEQGLYFLDMEIDNDKLAGLNVAERIRKDTPLAQIVFITTHDELSLTTLERKIAPMDYILKDKGLDEIKHRITDDIETAQKNLQKYSHSSKNLLDYKIGSRYFSILMDDIIMLYTQKDVPGRIFIITKNQLAEFNGSLNTFENEYPNLFRCNRSYLVNLENATTYDTHTRTLSFIDGSICEVSFRKHKELTKLLSKKN